MDLFEHYETLPQNVLDVLSKHEEGDFTYETCEALKNELEAIGYTCDYGLDASPYDLRELPEFEVGDTVTLDRYNHIDDVERVKVVGYGKMVGGALTYKMDVKGTIIDSTGGSIVESRLYNPVPNEDRHSKKGTFNLDM